MLPGPKARQSYLQVVFGRSDYMYSIHPVVQEKFIQGLKCRAPELPGDRLGIEGIRIIDAYKLGLLVRHYTATVHFRY